ncbi:class I SAM-dependent methyltransferase [Actinoplanes sp. NPDC049265]|uniref:class I SAM-dependent methyltransferase n=1 Tax=Actinoplanes sp. NPDC049265 TaxID=3363902 RepID=UPI003712B272
MDTRTSYDTVAAAYADLTREALAAEPYLRAGLGIFAELVAAAGGGPVADVGCGPGHVTAHLRGLGVDAFGLDLSPGMVALARREHPGVRFGAGSMTDLPLATGSVAGLIAFWSLIHVPDDRVPGVLGHFRRVLRPGGPLLVGFHAGDSASIKTSGYGGHPMNVLVRRRRPEVVADRLRAAGFAVDAVLSLDVDSARPGAIIIAR